LIFSGLRIVEEWNDEIVFTSILAYAKQGKTLVNIKFNAYLHMYFMMINLRFIMFLMTIFRSYLINAINMFKLCITLGFGIYFSLRINWWMEHDRINLKHFYGFDKTRSVWWEFCKILLVNFSSQMMKLLFGPCLWIVILNTLTDFLSM